MAEKVPYLVEEVGGKQTVVLAESGSHAKTAIRPELIVKKASAMDVINAQRSGAAILDADEEIARKEKAKQAMASGEVSSGEPTVNAGEPDAAGAPATGE